MIFTFQRLDYNAKRLIGEQIDFNYITWKEKDLTAQIMKKVSDSFSRKVEMKHLNFYPCETTQKDT